MNLPRSLANRLSLALVVAATALIGGAHTVVAGAAERALHAEFDRSLLDQARNLATLVEQERGKIEFDYVPRFHPEFERDASPEYFQVAMADGLVLMRSKHLTQDLVFERTRGEPWFGDATLADGHATRFAVFPFHAELGGKARKKAAQATAATATGPEVPHELVFVLLRGTEPLVAAVQSLRTTTWLAVATTLAVGIVVFRWLVRRGLRPVRSIAAQVQALDVDTAERRLAVPDAPTELQPVVDQTNALLDRLRDALLRERRFTGNIAHELRTPVAELRLLAEVAQRWPADRTAVQRFFADVAAVSDRMGRVIGDLLLLARCQGGLESCHTEIVPVRPAVHTALQRAGLLAGRHVAAELDVPDECRAVVDAGKFAIVLDNLVGNAVAHGLPGGTVRVRGGRTAGRFWLEIENAGKPLGNDAMRHIDEPFFQGDASRSSPEHAGLGLTLVRTLTTLLGTAFTCRQTADGTFTARLEGPGDAGDRRSRPDPRAQSA